jgi:hypothetical protein
VPAINNTCALCSAPYKNGDQVERFGTGHAHRGCINDWMVKERAERETRIEAAKIPRFRRGFSPMPAIEEVQQLEPVVVVEALALPPSVPKFDSKLELAYWQHLQRRLRDGEIRRADNHPERLLLGEGAWYTPDFRVIALDGVVEMHEVKGPFAREASIVRLKVAALAHPYRFFLAKNKGTAKTPSWELTRVGTCED